MVDYVNIGGQERPIKFGMNALRIYCIETGTKISELGEISDNLDIDKAIRLVLCGLKDGARYVKEPFSFTIEDVSDWLDEDGLLQKVFDIYGRQFLGNPQSPVENAGT